MDISRDNISLEVISTDICEHILTPITESTSRKIDTTVDDGGIQNISTHNERNEEEGVEADGVEATKENVTEINTGDTVHLEPTTKSSNMSDPVTQSASPEKYDSSVNKDILVIESDITLVPPKNEKEADKNASANIEAELNEKIIGKDEFQGLTRETILHSATITKPKSNNESGDPLVPDTDIEVVEMTQTNANAGNPPIGGVVIGKNTQLVTNDISTRSICMVTSPVKGNITSLGLLSQYESDTDEGRSDESETLSVVEVPIAVTESYRPPVVEIESDSSETISSESDSETESEYLTKIAKVIEKRIDVDDDENDDDEDDGGDDGTGKGGKKHSRRQPPRVRGEMLLDDLPPIQDLQISVPEEECIELGRVHSIIDKLLLVSVLPNSILLDLDTVLFLNRGKDVLGVVFDVLGQVADPLYCVRFNTNQHIQERGITVGNVVYVAPKTEYTQFVILSNLTKFRGSDASWENDIEPPPRYLDYSDDEEEREARNQMRKNRRCSVKEEESDDNDNDAMKCYRPQLATENGAQTQRGRESSGGSRRINERGDNLRGNDGHRSRPHVPRSFHTHLKTSWHSHYNQPYHPRYRSPQPGFHKQQRPAYSTPPTPSPYFNTYVRPTMPVPMMIPPAQAHGPTGMHSVPLPPTNMYVPNPFAFRPPTLSTQLPGALFGQPQPTEAIYATPEPAPPGAD